MITDKGPGLYEIKVFRVKDFIQASNATFLVRIEYGKLVTPAGRPLKLRGNMIEVTYESDYYLLPDEVIKGLKERGLKDDVGQE